MLYTNTTHVSTTVVVDLAGPDMRCTAQEAGGGTASLAGNCEICLPWADTVAASTVHLLPNPFFCLQPKRDPRSLGSGSHGKSSRPCGGFHNHGDKSPKLFCTGLQAFRTPLVPLHHTTAGQFMTDPSHKPKSQTPVQGVVKRLNRPHVPDSQSGKGFAKLGVSASPAV